MYDVMSKVTLYTHATDLMIQQVTTQRIAMGPNLTSNIKHT